MAAFSALIIDGTRPITLGGLTLTERAALLAQRIRLSPIRVRSQHGRDPAVRARLRARGIIPIDEPPASPIAAAGAGENVLIVGPNVLCDAATLQELCGHTAAHGAGARVVVGDAGGPLLMAVPASKAATLTTCSSLEEMATALAATGPVRQSAAAGFCRQVVQGPDVLRAEREYVRYLNGGASESFFTKIIRRFSVPLTSLLVRLGARPTHVTLGGLALAIGSAVCLAQGAYGAGLLGAVLYYVSMVFDCSDGEVARLTMRESAFGAWLETFVDYATYFLVLGALTISVGARPDADAYRIAALMALVGSVVVALVASYLRHRVAAADPGQFDESSARALASAGPVHRFARWARQWIKRSSVAHLIVALAIVDRLPVLLYLWAFGAVTAAVVILIVEPFVVRRVAVAPTRL